MHYIYRHIRLDIDEVFYVGKGTIIKNKHTLLSKYYRAFSKQRVNYSWNQIVNLTDYRVDILFETECEETAFDKEIEFISLYGRKDLKEGSLCNVSDGGEGTSGYTWTEEQKQTASLARRGISTATPHSRAVASELSKGSNNYFFGKSFKGKDNPFYGKKHTKECIEDKFKGENNPMFGRTGKLNPFYGKTHCKDFLRRKQLMHSNKVKIIENGIEIIFECVSDCAEHFKCTTKNILYRDKQFKLGKKPKSGMFKDIYLEILNGVKQEVSDSITK